MKIETKYKPIIKKHLVGLLMLVAAAVGLTLVAVLLIARNYQPDGQGAKETVQIKQVDASQIPARFPADIPIEANAEIVENFNATSESGAYQATREFVTSRPLAENYALYSAYMKNNGWELNFNADDEKYKTLIAMKGNSILQVTMIESSATGKNTVSISLTDNPVTDTQVIE